jgi:hypothetical protein
VSGVRGRRITALVAAGLLALAAAGCGGGEELAPQVPGPPAEVKVPQAAQAPGDAAAAAQNAAGDSDTSTDSTTGTDDSSGSASGDATATPTPAAGTDQSGGTAAPDTTADGPTNDTPPPDGSNAQQFEDFCAQNPGAC